MAITIDIGDALVNETANSAADVNTRFTTLKASIEDALSALTEITDGWNIKTTVAATGAIKTMLELEWDPSDGSNMTDNASGTSIDFKFPDSADNQVVFGRVVTMIRDDTDGAEEGEIALRAMVGGVDTELVTISGAGMLASISYLRPLIIGTIRVWHDTVNGWLRAKVGSNPSSTDEAGTFIIQWGT